MIVALGDSITFGQYLHPASAWPMQVGLPVMGRGVAGDTTRLGLERFPKDVQTVVVNEPSSIVIIQFGHNDANRWDTDRGLPRVSPGAFRANLEEMIDRCRAFRARPMLCSLTPSRRSEQHAEDVAKYDRLIRRVADDEGVTLIDVRAAFLPNADELLMEDGLHLTIEGHRTYGAAVRVVLDRESIG